MNELVRRVNELLQAGEPGNISVDTYSGYSGYEPQAIVDAMNEVLWGKWGFAEISSELVETDKGPVAVCQVSVSLADNEFHPVGWGQNRVTKGDVGDARKGAQTDAIKKALSYFSIGNRAYHGLLQQDKKPQPTNKSTGQALHQLAAPGSYKQHEANGNQEPIPLTLADVQERAVTTGVAKSRKDWQFFNADVLGSFVPDEKLKGDQKRLVQLNEAITKKASAGTGK
jgi:Rad52/22 family double-strand break repair protein